MEYKKRALSFIKFLENQSAKSMMGGDNSAWIQNLISQLGCIPLEACVDIICGALDQYIDAVRKGKATDPEAYRMVNEIGRPILRDFDWALIATIKEKKYIRVNSKQELISDYKKIVNDYMTEIASKALQLPYDQAINFLGEFAGAWVLSYPIDSIKRNRGLFMPVDWASLEEDYIYILSLRLEYELEEWSK
jgi:hypothetical protein